MSEVVKRSVKEVLAEIFPAANFDLDDVAAEIVERSDLGATLRITSRENAFQEAMAATITYYGQVVEELRGDNERLRLKVRDLNLAYARKATTSRAFLGTPEGQKEGT